MKIAIIGSGISGLTSAYLLNENHEITVFESSDYIGGHTHTHTIDIDNQKLFVDTGFIVYNENTYPNFINLLKKLNVESQPTHMGFSVKSITNNLEYAGNSLNAIFAQRLNILRPSFLIMLKNILRFNKHAEVDLHSISPNITLNNYLKGNNYSGYFINNYIIPMGAAIWSTKALNILDMPALFFISFFKNHSLLQIKNRAQWHVIKGGSNNYIKKMITDFKSRIRLSSPVKKVVRIGKKINVTFGSNNYETETFDAVIFANHSDQALKLIENPSTSERQILSAMPYQKNEVLLHTDDSILPSRKLAWSSWNYLLDQDPNKPVTLTYNMNILQNLKSSKTLCVTLNSNKQIDEKKILKKLIYHHPVFTIDSIKAQKRKQEISGQNNTYYCGAYWHNGFHEDGVVSALEVCKHFGKTI